jgi:hypothetical protein
VPVEAIDVEEGKKRNYRKLWEGIIGLMVILPFVSAFEFVVHL